jgi:hypothetical protein
MVTKCTATGKVIFSSLLEALLVMFNLKWGYRKHKDINGKRIKHRQGKPAQRRGYFCIHCCGYHLTKWKTNEFNSYNNREEAGLIEQYLSMYIEGH